MAAHQAPPSLGFSRQEHWSGLPLPSPLTTAPPGRSLFNLHQHSQLSVCPLPGTLPHIERRQKTGFLTLRCSLLSVGNKKFWYKVLTRGTDPCLRRPWLQEGAFSSARLVGRQWLMKLASDEKRVVGLKTKWGYLALHFTNVLAIFCTCPCFDSIKILELAPPVWLIPVLNSLGMTHSYQTAYYYPSQKLTGPS